jgi:hypothetical protein
MKSSLMGLFVCTIVVLALMSTSSAQPCYPGMSSGPCPAMHPVTPELLKANPWIKSKTLADMIGRDSSVEELRDMITGLQNSVITHGLNRHMGAQRGNCGDEDAPKPTNVEDVRCSRLIGIQMTGQNDGSYLMEVYLEVAPSGGETKYLSVGAMAHDGVPPVETIRLKGHKYTHTVHGVAYNGTF